MKNKLSNCFFLWTYFGIDTKAIPADILSAAINKAYKDATMRKALDISKYSLSEKKEFEKNAFDNVFFSICNLMPSLDFSKWHKKICNDLVRSTALSYGNAQKLVNMTIKYLYLIANFDISFDGELPDYRGWYDYRLKTYEFEFHIPIDNLVMQYIYEDNKNNHTHWGEEEEIFIKKVTSTSYRFVDGKNEFTWSNIPDYKTYMKIQRAIITCYKPKNPIEWENKIWIETAKRRNAQKVIN